MRGHFLYFHVSEFAPDFQKAAGGAPFFTVKWGKDLFPNEDKPGQLESQIKF